MIDGWVTGTVDGRPRLTTKGGAETVAVKLRVANGAGPSLYANAFASDDEPMDALVAARHGDMVVLFGALVIRAWAVDGNAKPGLDIAVSSVLSVERPEARSAHVRARARSVVPTAA